MRRLRRLAGLLASGGYDIVHFHTARAHAMTAFIGRSRARRIVTRRMDYRLRGGSYARTPSANPRSPTSSPFAIAT